jgi:hypothetical protein
LYANRVGLEGGREVQTVEDVTVGKKMSNQNGNEVVPLENVEKV